jgi:AraC-like DNA-binding protein
MRSADSSELQVTENAAGGPRGRNRARVWLDRELPGLEAMAIRLETHAFKPHTHSHLMVGLIEAGAKAFKREGRAFVATPGSISIVNSGDLHTGSRHAGQELSYYALYIPEEIIGKAVGEESLAAAPRFCAGVVNDSELYRGLFRVFRAVAHRHSRLERESFLTHAMCLLVRRYGGDGSADLRTSRVRAPQGVQRAREMIAARFAEDISIDEIVSATRLSRFHLMHEFRRHVGLPMHAYQLQLRIEQAKVRLAAGATVVNVALDTGFADQSHFSKRFKGLVGVAPATYRRDTMGSLQRGSRPLLEGTS